MLTRWKIIGLVCCSLHATGALAAPWKIAAGTTISVDANWNGSVVPVHFPSVGGAVDFDEKNIQAARATIAVATRNATTGVPIVDGLVRSDDYLAADRFPQITFRLDRLVQTSASTADVTGRITLRGVTKPVVFHATVIRYGPGQDDPGRFEAGFDMSGVIDRTEFGSNGGLPEVAGLLPIHIRLMLSSR
jgi:polyisoprenoid-binding protein YceI